MTETAIRARIEGKVQNVWYRAWASRAAAERGLRGWVRNCADGSVEALFIGPAGAVRAMIESCRTGPPAARVTRIVESADADDGSQGFRQLPTV